MSKFLITTDNTSDMPANFYQDNDTRRLYLNCVFGDEVFDGINKDIFGKEFYDRMRNGEMPITQQVNPENSKEFFTAILEQGYDILHIAFSSALSGTCNSAVMAADELRPQFPDRKLIVVDSLCASGAEGLLVYECVQQKKRGDSIDAIAAWAEDNKLKMVHNILTADLFHLHRGGRVKKSAAVIGSALSIKPLLRVSDEGKLDLYAKPRGKANAITLIMNDMSNNIIFNDQTNTMIICHGDNLELATELKNAVLKKFPSANIIMSYVGTIIGTHTGPGTVGIFYYGKTR